MEVILTMLKRQKDFLLIVFLHIRPFYFVRQNGSMYIFASCENASTYFVGIFGKEQSYIIDENTLQ